jgi:hypothetical protein
MSQCRDSTRSQGIPRAWKAESPLISLSNKFVGLACRLAIHPMSACRHPMVRGTSLPRGFSTCIESRHVTCSQRLRIFIEIICLYGFIWILYRFISIYMALIFFNLRKWHSWTFSTCIWSPWSYLVNIWSDCEWIGPDSDILKINYGVTGTISTSTSTVEVPREFPRLAVLQSIQCRPAGIRNGWFLFEIQYKWDIPGGLRPDLLGGLGGGCFPRNPLPGIRLD